MNHTKQKSRGERAVYLDGGGGRREGKEEGEEERRKRNELGGLDSGLERRQGDRQGAARAKKWGKRMAVVVYTPAELARVLGVPLT